MENKRQPIELSTILRQYRETFLEEHSLCPEQLKAYNAITDCRTSALGGHSEKCCDCGYTRVSYNSCRNRHCPKCQATRKQQWVDKLAANLPPVRHFHVVFTIPACLNATFYLNQDKAYSLLFKAAGQALLKCALNPAYLGVQAGAVAVLHTWGQTLVYHPHIHMIVPAGGLSSDQMEWIPSNKKFFLPVKALSNIFRGILCLLIEQAVIKNELILPENTINFQILKNQCYQKNWVIYCQKPFAGPEAIVNYLGNYTHKVAISNHRIKAFEGGKVTFSYKDYKTNALLRDITLEAGEFIRRFFQHVLPCGFYKIRYFGIFALCNTGTKLEACRNLISGKCYLPVLEGLNAMEVWQVITGRDLTCCPKCGTGRMVGRLPVAAFSIEPG